MIDYLLSSQAPDKGDSVAETGLPSLFANVALVAVVIILRPALERYLGLAVNKHTPISRPNRQSLKAIFVAGHDFISPALDGFSIPYPEVKPHSATIATTVIKGVPTPVQLLQEQSTMGAILGISACLVFALVGTILVFQHSGQSSILIGSSSPYAASSDNSGSSPPPSDYDSTPPSDDSSDSGSGGRRPPPAPIFDIFYDAPILHADKAVNTNDKKEVGDMDGAPPPPPPPSFPTPAEDGHPFKSEAILKWSSLTLVLSIISLVINRLFKRFFRGRGKAEKNLPTPTAHGWIPVDEISGNVMSPIPSVTAKPVFKLTCPNMLPLVETESLGTNISTLVTSTVYQRSRGFTDAAIICILFLTISVLLPYFLQDYIDNHLSRTINFICPAETRRQSLKASAAVEILGPVDETASIEDDLDDATTSIDGERVAADLDEDIVASIGEELVALDDDVVATSTGGGDVAGADEGGLAATTDDLMKKSVEQDISPDHTGAEDTTFVYENTSPLAVDIKDVFNTTEDDIPFLEVFSALSISSSSDEISVSKGRSSSSIHSMFKLPTTSEAKCAVGGRQDIRAFSEYVPQMNIPVAVEQVHTISTFVLEKAASIVDKASNTAKIDTTSKENVPIVNINKAFAPARAETLPVSVKSSTTNMKTSFTEPLNPRAASFVPPVSHIPVRQQPRQTSSNSLSLHYCYSPPSPQRPGLSASMHAPSPVRRALNASIHAASQPPRQGLSASIHAPSPPPKQGLSASIHAPSPPPMGGTSASIHAPSSLPMGGTSAGIHAPSSPQMGGTSASIHAPCTPPRRTTNSGTSAPIEDETAVPSGPVPIPVVDLSPNRNIRRLIDPRRECNVVVLVGGDSASAA